MKTSMIFTLCIVVALQHTLSQATADNIISLTARINVVHCTSLQTTDKLLLYVLFFLYRNEISTMSYNMLMILVCELNCQEEGMLSARCL